MSIVASILDHLQWPIRLHGLAHFQINRYVMYRSAGKRVRGTTCVWLSCALAVLGCGPAHAGAPTTAFFYGSPVPVAALSHYDRVIVEAENMPHPHPLIDNGVDVFAYVSVGEAEGWRGSTKELDAKLFIGNNAPWESRIADLTQPAWATFLIEKRMAPLWNQGYRAFFLDTLDSYQIPIKDPQGQALQAKALANIIRSMHTRFPGVKLLLNRGFEVLPDVGHLAVGLVAESLFQGWDANTKTYVKVDEPSRAWLLDKLRTAHSRYGLSITVIDYVSPQEPALALDTARRIRDLGFTPWVALPSLDTLDIMQAQ